MQHTGAFRLALFNPEHYRNVFRRHKIVPILLQSAVGFVGPVVLTPAGRQAEIPLVGRPAAGAAEAPRMNKGLQVEDGMTVLVFPVHGSLRAAFLGPSVQ
jgi:hypothetical protein